MTEFNLQAKVAKVDESLGLVMGYAMVCKINGEPYFDRDSKPYSDHIPEDVMLKESTDFMLNSRIGGEMHATDENDKPVQKGTVVFAWPMTTEIAEAFNVKVEKTGLMIAMKPDAETLAKFKSGELTAFSIGGHRIKDEPLDDDA